MGTKKAYLRRLLLDRSNWIEQRLIDHAEINGYGDVTPAMSRLFAHLAGSKPISLSELGRRLSVTRQAVHKLANEAARLNYVEFFDSEDDARIKLLRFTQRGRDMAKSAEKELDGIEAELTLQIGETRLTQLKSTLALPWEEAERHKIKS